MTTQRRPNVLWILADDLGWGDVGYHGSEIRTPNIDRMARHGVELDQHYVCPVCTPTRTSLMSGRHPGRFGRHATAPTNEPVFPDGYETLARMLQSGGYETALFGKWHLGSDPKFRPNEYGFDTSYGSLAGGVDPYSHRYKEGKFSFTWHKDGERLDEVGHVTDLITGRASEWIATRDGERPWFCYVPFTAVHTPIRAPQEWIDRYQGQHFDDDPDRDRSYRTYAGYTSHMDHAVGRLVETLAATGQDTDTLVVFVSDNGSPARDTTNDTDSYPGWHEWMPRIGSNLPLRGRKAQMYEGGIRTPAVCAWAGTLERRKVTAPMHVADWMPTLSRLCGCEPAGDPQWDGIDVWDAISGHAERLPDRPIYWNLQHSRFAIRLGDWKLIARGAEPDAEKCELFDLADDPYENDDRSAEKPEKVRELLDVLAEQRRGDDSSQRDDVEGTPVP